MKKFLSIVLTYVLGISLILQGVPVKASAETKKTTLASTAINYMLSAPLDSGAFNLNENLVGSTNSHFVVDLGLLRKIATTDTPINISTDGYYVLNITDPLGKPAANGNVQVGKLDGNSRFSTISNSMININGTAFIKKIDLYGYDNEIKIIISGFTADTKEPYIYYRDFSTSTTSYSATNTKIINIKTNLGITQNPEAYLFISCGKFDLQTPLNISNNYNDFNLYLDRGIYDIGYYINSYPSEYHLIKQNIDTSMDNSVIFDKTNISKIVPVYDGTLSANSPYVKLRNLNLFINGGSSTNQYYSKGIYDEVDTGIYVDNVQPRTGTQFVRENFTVKDDITEIHFGKGLHYSAIGYSQGIPFCITLNKSNNLYYSMSDNEGFNTNLYGNYGVNFYQNGSLIQTVNTGLSNSFTVQSLPEGYYDVEVYYLNSQSPIKLESKKVYVGASDSSFVDINNYPCNSDINIYGGTNNVYSGNYSEIGECRIPKNTLDTSKTYTAYITGNDNYNGTKNFSANLIYDSVSSQWTLNYPSNLINLSITNAKGMSVTVKDSSGRMATGESHDNENFNLQVTPGTYNLNFKGIGVDGNFYDFNRILNVGSETNTYALDYSNLSKVAIADNYSLMPTYGSYTFTKADNSISASFEDNDLQNGIIAYIDKGSYKVDISKTLRGAKNTVNGTYVLDCSGNNATLALGSKLCATTVFEKTFYNVGDSPVISSVKVTDGGTELKGFDISDFSIESIDVMHGNKVIKSFNGFIPNYLKGECELRVNMSNPLLGKVTKVQSVTINNNSLTVDGDINLDGIVDIYDLVLMSKDMGKTLADSSDWDGRCNIDNSDNSNVIDIKDIAKAAQNYNKVAVTK